jgi:hypothetical protein
LKVAGNANASEIATELTRLKQGECFVWLPGQELPEKVKIPEKNTIHPDRRKPAMLKKAIPANVVDSVEKMKRHITQQRTMKVQVPELGGPKVAKDAGEPIRYVKTQEHQELEATKVRLETSLKATKNELQDALAKLRVRDMVIGNLRERLRPEYENFRQLFGNLDEVKQSGGVVDAGKYDVWRQSGRLKAGEIQMLDLFIRQPEWTKQQLDVAPCVSSIGVSIIA